MVMQNTLMGLLASYLFYVVSNFGEKASIFIYQRCSQITLEEFVMFNRLIVLPLLIVVVVVSVKYICNKALGNKKG